MIDFKMTKELVISLVFFILVIVFGFWSLLALIPLVFIILFKWFKNGEVQINISLLDLAFILLGIGEIFTTLCSSYPYKGNTSSFKLYIILVLYFVYRKFLKDIKKKILFSTVLFFVSIIITLITIISFGIHYSNLLEENLKELNNYKNLYNPLGIWNNLWACILLLLSVFTILFVIHQKKQKFKILGIFILLLFVFGIIVSFSRGIYLSFIFFILSFNTIVIIFEQLKIKKLLMVNTMAFLMALVSFSIVSNSVLTTLSFNKTTSQKRSTSGRVDRWEQALNLISDKPLTGWGNDNFILANDKNPFLSEDADFSPTIDNTYIQILIEKGILGFITYLFLLIICFIIIYKSFKNKTFSKKQKLELTIISCGLIAFLVRELTFSSLFVNNAVFFLFFHLIFFLVPFDIKCYNITFSKRNKNLTAGLLMLFTSFIIYSHVKHAIVNNLNNQFVKAFNKNEKDAFHSLNKAINHSPNDIILNKHKALLFAKNSLEIDLSSNYVNFIEFKNIDTDSLTISKKHLKNILKSNLYDDEVYHNLGWIYLALKDKDSAKIYFNKALHLRPFNSTYRVSKMLNNIKHSKYDSITNDLSKIIRYTPDIIESIFYKEFAMKHPKIAQSAKEDAILGLKKALELDNNPILKARLARLLLDINSNKSLKLLKEVTNSLPNLNRPWTYKAYLLANQGDTAKAKEYFNKAIFFNNSDYLTKLYYAEFLRKTGDDKNSIAKYKEALQAYTYITSETYKKNKEFSNLKTIKNSYIPNDLLYYVKPDINTKAIFNYFIDYYKNSNNKKLYEFYNNLFKKYKNQLYKGNELLR